MVEKSAMAKAFEEATPKEEVKIEEFDSLIKHYREIEDRLDAIEVEKKAINEEKAEVKAMILNLLNRTGRNNWEVPGVGMAYKSTKLEVWFPERVPDRRKVIAWIEKKRGEEFKDSVLTINYQTMNKIYKEEREKASERGELDSFKIDGLGDPISKENVGFRRK